MVAVTDINPDVLAEAILTWTGWGTHPIPVRDEAVVIERYGDEAVELMPVISKLEDDLYKSDARDVAADEAEMVALASADFRSRHPYIRDDAIRALAWCYAYDYK